MSGLGFELESKQSKHGELGRSRRAGWTKPGKIQGNPVLPLSISTLRLRGSNEAEMIKSNSSPEHTMELHVRKENRAEISTPIANTKKGFRTRRRALDGGQGPGFILTAFEIHLWIAKIKTPPCPHQTRVFCLREHLSSSSCPAWETAINPELTPSASASPQLSVQFSLSRQEGLYLERSWHSDVQRWIFSLISG